MSAGENKGVQLHTEGHDLHGDVPRPHPGHPQRLIQLHLHCEGTCGVCVRACVVCVGCVCMGCVYGGCVWGVCVEWE